MRKGETASSSAFSHANRDHTPHRGDQRAAKRGRQRSTDGGRDRPIDSSITGSTANARTDSCTDSTAKVGSACRQIITPVILQNSTCFFLIKILAPLTRGEQEMTHNYFYDLPVELQAHIHVMLGMHFCKWGYSLNPNRLTWVNHTECQTMNTFNTQFGKRFSCRCPRVTHTSPLFIQGPKFMPPNQRKRPRKE